VRRPIGAGVLLVVLLLAAGPPALAGDPKLDAARAHSQEGDSYYKLEKYTNAITEYEQAYLAKPDPSFLYNIAQCHRLMGNGAEAIHFYRRFLKDAPNAPNRAVAEKHIRDLEDIASHGTASIPPMAPLAPLGPAPVSPPPPSEAPLAPLPSTPTSPPPALSAPPPTSTPVSTTPTVENGTPSSQTESQPIYHKWWFWAGVGAVVVGGIVLIAATAKHDPPCPGGVTCGN
jgi:tetratricopeptide (TPR) repeat protein